MRGAPPIAAGNFVIPRERPSLSRHAIDEPERAIPDRVRVERDATHLLRGHCAQQVHRHDGQLREDSGKLPLRRVEANHESRIVGRGDRADAVEVRGAGKPGLRVARGLQRERHVAGGRRRAVMPRECGIETQRQRAPGAVPSPVAREVRSRRERAVVSRERHEKHVALHLPGQRVNRHQRIRRLEIGARRIDDDVARTRRAGARAERENHRDD